VGAASRQLFIGIGSGGNKDGRQPFGQVGRWHDSRDGGFSSAGGQRQHEQDHDEGILKVPIHVPSFLLAAITPGEVLQRLLQFLPGISIDSSILPQS